MLYLTVSFLALFLRYSEASHEMWPWMAFIPSHQCSGVIVDTRWLLTSSHCFGNKSNMPSDLFIQVQEPARKGKLPNAREIFVIDYTREKRLESTNGLTLLYLARTIPSLTQKTVSLRAQDSAVAVKTAIVLSWDSRSNAIGFESRTMVNNSNGVNIIALSVNIAACAGHSPYELCASLDKHLSSASGSALYCPRISLGSPLVFLDDDGDVSLLGLLRQKSHCHDSTKLLGRFSRVSVANKWIRRQFRVQDFPQCKPNIYRNLDNSLRDLRKNRDGPSVLCDTSILRAWYRFTLQDQPAELPTSCPPANKCGSSSTVWLPLANAIEIGKQIAVKACATWTIGEKHMCCFWKLSVFVRHCGDFKVYRLRRTDACPTSYCSNVTNAYCGAGKIGYKPNCKATTRPKTLCITVSWKASEIQRSSSLPTVLRVRCIGIDTLLPIQLEHNQVSFLDSYPKLPKVLHLYPFFTHQGALKTPYIYLRCLLYAVVPKSENVLYSFTFSKVDRRPNGKLVKQTIRTLETKRSYCDTIFQPARHRVALGDTVVCTVRSFFRSTMRIKSPPLSSKIRHLGIEVHPSSTATLRQFQNLLITFFITMPVICRQGTTNCTLTIPLTTFLTDSVTGEKVDADSHFTLSKCSLVFTPKRCTRQNIDCGRETILLKAGKNLRSSNLLLQIRLGPVMSNDAIWKNINFPVVNTILKPTLYSSCFAMSGSNMKTFSGSFFKHLGEGTFVLYQKLFPPIEVQMKKWGCNGMSTCPCAVAVREGNDVIIANMCSGQYNETSLRIIVRSKPPLHQQTRIVESNDGKTFTIKLPSGSYLTIDEFEWGINIFFATTELGESGGLCHELNVKETNNNKLQRNIKESDSLFYIPIHTLKPHHSSNVAAEFCTCYGQKTVNVSEQDCPAPILHLSLDGYSRDVTQRIIDYQTFLNTSVSLWSKARHGPTKSLQSDSPSYAMSYDQRQTFCQEMLNETGSLLLCKSAIGDELWENIYQICLQDTQEGLDAALLQSNRKIVTRLCEHKLEQVKNKESVMRRWKLDFCERRCGKNGKCQNGKCLCNEGYGSNDCSVLLNSSPKIFSLQDPGCDDRHDNCQEVFVSGATFFNSDHLSCSFTPVQRIKDAWKEELKRKFTGKALFYSSRGVICTLPTNKRSGFVKSFEAYHISVSSNGKTWSKPVGRFIYDSLCKKCSDNGVCSTKPDTCDIDSRCFINNEIHPKNRCLKCSPARDPLKWSLADENLPPVFLSPVDENITVFVNDLVAFAVKAKDPENGPITIRHNIAGAHLSIAGEFQWRPDEVARRTIRFLATDECGRSTAKYIDVIIRACLCENGGICPKTSNKSYRCVCPENFDGKLCERKILPCSSNPCAYGTCVNIGFNFSCVCRPGYRGTRCEIKIPACASNPCRRGSCVDLASGFRCICPKYYTGALCDRNIGPCGLSPCIRGTCKVSKDESFECICPKGFHGKLCSQKRTPCSPNPCNRGRCTVLGTNFLCICPVKHHGKYCNLTRLLCGSKPCINGVCESTMIGQQCVCQRGFSGEQCDVTCDIDCVHGDCITSGLGTTCSCHEGYSGLDCTFERSICETNPCFHGECLESDDGFVCRCSAGYSGPLCNVSACLFGCINGTCTVVNDVASCRCFDGYFGERCDRQTHQCDLKPCSNGLCIANKDSFNCSCNPGYQGLLCDQKIDPCSASPCRNGICQAVSDGDFSCVCYKGYKGRICQDRDIRNACFSNPCVYGTCLALSDVSFRCKCSSGYVGVHCERRFNICSSNPCANGGSCFSVYEGTFYCSCASGYSGTLCEINHRPCSKKPCFKDVSCLNVGNTFKCGECPSGFVGNGVECRPEHRPTATTRSPFHFVCPRQFCYPGVQCSIVNSQIHCGKCPQGYFGNGFKCKVFCYIACQNGGTCIKPGVCQCPPGYVGATCQRVLCKRSCLNGGRCVAPGRCVCPTGFFGSRCQNGNCRVKCLNGGRCIPPDKCQCLRGYTGPACGQAVCSLPCLNGGLCVKPGTCLCPPGYFGARCQEGTCFPQCRNGGVCVRNNNCACPSGYRGSRCQTAVCLRPCQNGGRCFKKDQCSCPYGYWGKVCQYVRCVRPCMNGGICIKPNVCLCPQQYAGVSCENFVD